MGDSHHHTGNLIVNKEKMSKDIVRMKSEGDSIRLVNEHVLQQKATRRHGSILKNTKTQLPKSTAQQVPGSSSIITTSACDGIGESVQKTKYTLPKVDNNPCSMQLNAYKKRRMSDMNGLVSTTHDIALKTKLISPPIPGYTGHVPGEKLGGLGINYGLRTRQNLTNYWTRRNLKMEMSTAKYNVHNGKLLPPVNNSSMTVSKMSGKDPEKEIYSTTGLLPQYTGHIPGHLSRIGVTYGQSTRDFAYQHTRPFSA